jgi:hypothetical protein
MGGFSWATFGAASTLSLLMACGESHGNGTGDDGAGADAGGNSNGGTGGANANSGGTGAGRAGAASGSAGQGAAGRAAAVGLQMTLTAPAAADNPEGRSCPVLPNGSRSYGIGQPHGDGTLEDGTDGVELACTVRASGEISLELDAENQVPGLSGAFGMTLSGVIGSETDATLNPATLEFFDEAAGTMSSPGTHPCTLSSPPGTAGVTHQPGALWARFTCPLITSLIDPADGCRAEGVVAIEYCRTGED